MLDEALGNLESSEKMGRILGEHFIQVFAAVKRTEYQHYFQVISPWEREYLLLSV